MSRRFVASSGDYIDAGNPAALDITGDKVSLMGRINLSSINGEQKWFAKWQDAGDQFQWLMSVNSDDHLIFAVYVGGGVVIAEGTTALSPGIWNHAAGVYDGVAARAYLNGVQEAATAASGNLTSRTAPVRIGGGSGGENPFDGKIGPCALYDTALAPGEVASQAAGVSPLQMHKDGGLKFHTALNGRSPEYDVIGGLSLTVNGSTKAAEPPIPNSIVAP